MFEHISLALPFMLGGVLQLVTSALYHFFAHLPPPEEAEAQAQVQAANDARELTAARTRQEPELADDG